jgi:hypothetical protein
MLNGLRTQPGQQSLITGPPTDTRSEPPQPQLCECARIGKRSLSWAPWLGLLSGSSQGGMLDRNNIEFSHEHILFEGTGENIGFGPNGLFTEDISRYRYRWEDHCYSGDTVRAALSSIAVSKKYNFFLNNCQDFISKVRDRYQELSSHLKNIKRSSA